jgi:hypothetical protein
MQGNIIQSKSQIVSLFPTMRAKTTNRVKTATTLVKMRGTRMEIQPQKINFQVNPLQSVLRMMTTWMDLASESALIRDGHGTAR